MNANYKDASHRTTAHSDNSTNHFCSSDQCDLCLSTRLDNVLYDKDAVDDDLLYANMAEEMERLRAENVYLRSGRTQKENLADVQDSVYKEKARDAYRQINVR